MMFCAKFEISPVVWRRRIFRFVNVFLLFCSYLPLEKGGAIHLNKLKSPSPKNALWQVWLELAQWFWRRFLYLVNIISFLCFYLPLVKDGSLHLNKLESPLPKDALYQVWLKLVQCFWRRRRKCEKFTTTTTTGKLWSEKLTWAIGSGELKSEKNDKCLSKGKRNQFYFTYF